MSFIIPLAMGAASATAGFFLTPLVATATLGVVGFGPAGPVAGTMAASMQARKGNAVAGDLFSTAQRVAMGGAFPPAITAIGAGVAGVSGAVLGATPVGASVASMSIGAASAVGAGIGAAAAGVAGMVAGMGAAAIAATAAAL